MDGCSPVVQARAGLGLGLICDSVISLAQNGFSHSDISGTTSLCIRVCVQLLLVVLSLCALCSSREYQVGTGLWDGTARESSKVNMSVYVGSINSLMNVGRLCGRWTE